MPRKRAAALPPSPYRPLASRRVYRSMESRTTTMACRRRTRHTVLVNRFAEAERCRADSHLSSVPPVSLVAKTTSRRRSPCDRTGRSFPAARRRTTTATIERGDTVDNRGEIDGRACPPRARAYPLSFSRSLALSPSPSSCSALLLRYFILVRSPGEDRRPRATLRRRPDNPDT